MTLLAFAAVLASLAGAQPTSPARSALVTASVAGVVTAADTQAPLPRVRVVLTSNTVPAPRTAITDAEGRYEIGRLPAGLYHLTFSRSGYVTQRFAAPIELAERQRVEQAHVTMEPAGVIHGRILDEDGTPLGGARVEALQSGVKGGRRVLALAGRTVSDDRGEFRIIGLRVGTYVVAASDPAFDGAGDDRGALVYVPTYYPGVSTPERATGVTAATRPAAIDFRLRLVRPVEVSGRLVAPNDGALRSAAVIMSPQVEEYTVNRSVGEARISPDGTFSFSNVPPGRYAIRGRGETEREGAALFATYSVTVESHDVRQLTLALTPGASVEGRITVEARHGHEPPAPSTLRVRAPLADGSAFGDSFSGAVAPDGSFRLTAMMPGPHVLIVEGLPFPWRIGAARVLGRDVAEQPLEIEREQEFRGAQILLTDTAAGVRGQVEMPAGASPEDVIVVAMPADALRRRVPLRFVRTARPAASGAYRVVDLPPGEYLVLAGLRLAESDLMDPRFLDGLVPLGTPVTLGEAHLADVPLQIKDVVASAVP